MARLHRARAAAGFEANAFLHARVAADLAERLEAIPRRFEHALALARRLESGQASVNNHTRGIRPHLPFGGFKWSGIGVENGHWGYEAYTQLQTIAAPPRQQ